MQTVCHLHGHKLQQFAETDRFRCLHSLIAADDALDLADQEIGFVQTPVEGRLRCVSADMGIVLEFIFNLIEILGRNQGTHLQVINRQLVQIHGRDKKVGACNHIFVDLSLAIRLQNCLISQLILESCHHQSGHAKSAGADDADIDLSGVLFIFFDALLCGAKVHGEETDFLLIDFVSGLLCDHLCRTAAGFKDLRIFLFDVLQNGIMDSESRGEPD